MSERFKSTPDEWGLPEWVLPIAWTWINLPEHEGGTEGEAPATLEVMQAWAQVYDWNDFKHKLALMLQERFVNDALGAVDHTHHALDRTLHG